MTDSLYIAPWLQVAVGIMLFFMMLAVALEIPWNSYNQVLKKPKPLIFITTFKLLFLPLLAIGLSRECNFPADIQLALILISVIPSGNLANYFVHLSGGDVSYSLVHSVASSLAALITTPLLFKFWIEHNSATALMPSSVHITIAQMFYSLIITVLVPLFLGAILSKKYPAVCLKIKKPVAIIPPVLLITFFLGAVSANYNLVLNETQNTVIPILLYYFIIFLVSGLSSFLLFRSKILTKTSVYALVTQNSGIGLLLCVQYFSQLPKAVLLVALWGIFQMVLNFATALYWRSRG
jgi:BASS family bile acid:Na+ symporter